MSALLFAALAASAAEPVLVNGQPVATTAIPAGDYWYDARSGLWGLAGGPALGVTAAGAEAAPLKPDASRGDSPVFVNGRQLQGSEWIGLSQLVGSIVLPGRYWLDATGKAGLEGGPALVDLASTSASASQGTFYSDNSTGGSISGGVWSGGGMVSVKNSDGTFSSVGW